MRERLKLLNVQPSYREHVIQVSWMMPCDIVYAGQITATQKRAYIFCLKG